MALTEKLKNVSGQLQVGAQTAAHSLTHIILRLVSGFFVGLVLAMITQEMTRSGSFMLLFATCVYTFVIYKALSRLSVLQIVVFDLICVLIATVLRMYIQLAP